VELLLPLVEILLLLPDVLSSIKAATAAAVFMLL
jgi:hypothetical protein